MDGNITQTTPRMMISLIEGVDAMSRELVLRSSDETMSEVMDDLATAVSAKDTFRNLTDFHANLNMYEVFSSPDAFAQCVFKVNINDTYVFINDDITRCLVLLQLMGIFASEAPPCEKCNRKRMPTLMQIKRKRGQQQLRWERPAAEAQRRGSSNALQLRESLSHCKEDKFRMSMGKTLASIFVVFCAYAARFYAKTNQDRYCAMV